MMFFLFLIISLGLVKDSTKLMQNQSEFVFVEGNEYIQSFYISRFEVTISQYLDFQKATGYKTIAERIDSGIVYDPKFRFSKGVNFRHDLLGKPINKEKYDILPAARMTLEDALAYAQWLGARIPTNEEWAYAARGGKKSKNYKYPGGNNPSKLGHFDSPNAIDITEPQPIGQKEPNELGIYDMGGNLREITFNPKEPELVRALGGHYFNGPSSALLINIQNGAYSTLTYDLNHPSPLTGFRIIKYAR